MNSTLADIKWQRTSSIAVVFFLFHAARKFVINGLPAIAVVGASYASGGPGRRALMLSGLLVLFAISVIYSILHWLRFRFCVIDERILIRRGIFHQEELSVDFVRIQNISIREPFYMRPFGLAILGIDTAGSGKKEIMLGGIRKDLATQLRETILSMVRDEPEENDQVSKAGSDQSLLLSRSGKDIVIYGLTVNFLLWFAIAVGAFFGAQGVAENIFTWVGSKIQVEDVIATAQNSAGFLGPMLLAVGMVFAVLLLLPLISVLGALFRHYGYRLSVDGETYRKTSGLLTRHDESMKRHKIQAIVFRQNFVARYFKRTNMQLRVTSAGSGVESGELPTGPKAPFVIPALHAFEVSDLSTEFFPDSDVASARYSRIDRRRFTTFILALMVIPVLSVTSTLSLLLSWKFVAIVPIVFGIAWLVISRYWKKTGYAVVGDYGFVRRGFIGTQTTVFPLFKVQRVDIRQTPGQRRRGLGHLSIHLASHSLKVPYVRIEDAEKLRDRALYHVESSNEAWY